jgi:hypothetical protein
MSSVFHTGRSRLHAPCQNRWSATRSTSPKRSPQASTSSAPKAPKAADTPVRPPFPAATPTHSRRAPAGDIPSSILIPACVDAVRGHTSPLTRGPVHVLGAGGVADGRALAANLMWGAVGVWVRPVFSRTMVRIVSDCAGCVCVCLGRDAVRRVGGGGRAQGAQGGAAQRRVRRRGDDAHLLRPAPARPPHALRRRLVNKPLLSSLPPHAQTRYTCDRNNNRQEEIKALTARGVLPVYHDFEQRPAGEIGVREAQPWLIGSVAARISEVLPARTIVEDMVCEAAGVLEGGGAMVRAKL